MTRSALISVVIPTYNRSADLARALRSLGLQTERDFEVLVCDDGSTDDSRAVVASVAREMPVEWIDCPRFGGPARPRNFGVRAARGEWVAFLDSDDWWLPQKLAEFRRVAAVGADFHFHRLEVVPASTRWWRATVGRALRATDAFDALRVHGNTIPTSTVVARRSLLTEVGGFSEEPSLVGSEDYDAWLRCARAGAKFEFSPAVLGCYWQAGTHITAPERTIRAIGEIERRYPLSSQQSTVTWCAIARAQAYRALGRYAEAKAESRSAMRSGASMRIRARGLLEAVKVGSA